MFTGLITDIGILTHISEQNQSKQFTIQTHIPNPQLKIGASIACNGACLTVTHIDKQHFTATLSAETLASTNMNQRKMGERINLEFALTLNQPLDGHLLQGHVEGTAQLNDITTVGDAHQLTLTIPTALLPNVVPKGSIALEGISLTVNQVAQQQCNVMIIPHSWTHTNISDYKIGDQLNLETDIIARYVKQQTQPYLNQL